MPGLTVLIPHYGEQILLCHKDLVADKNDEEVPLIAWLEKRYHGDFTAFTSRMKALMGTRSDLYIDHIDSPFERAALACLCFTCCLHLCTS